MNTIKALREHTGMSQYAFAGYIGAAIRTVEHWEAGIAEPPVYAFNALRAVLLHDFPEQVGDGKRHRTKRPDAPGRQYAEPDKETWQAAIRSMREATGLSQTKFCAKYGMGLSSLVTWEGGRRTVPGYAAKALERLIFEIDYPEAPRVYLPL